DLGVLLITHYQRLLNYITPDFVHVLAQGRIVKSGGKDLALRLEEEATAPTSTPIGSPWRPPARRAHRWRSRPARAHASWRPTSSASMQGSARANSSPWS